MLKHHYYILLSVIDRSSLAGLVGAPQKMCIFIYCRAKDVQKVIEDRFATNEDLIFGIDAITKLD